MRVVLKDDTISNLERPPDLFLLFELLYDGSHRILHAIMQERFERLLVRNRSLSDPVPQAGQEVTVLENGAFGGKRFVDYAEGELLLVKEVGHHISRESYDGAPQS
ncbi:hypothetical protein BFJ63_vAg18426 [Fusarium oxysporum f. sp. narcissi]|uniref:Uncharacterized protein n=2 Tax=Fusarium oxysporum f. sp. narcissi TaxID=451672 RepID=A0A4Q2UWI1_FUSOX|nr:hypothetical protein BFJ63_vAg18426 [Fusarium oxysporum f. sp. narcissi]